MENQVNLRQELRKGIVTFQFEKKDGTIRTAKGTTNPEFLADKYTSKGGSGPERYGYTNYWDVEKNGWRCFDESRLIAVL